MKTNQKVLLAIIMFTTMFFSSQLFSQCTQVNHDVYGIEANNLKKLLFKVSIKTLNNQKIKGFLTKLNEESISISILKYISVDKTKSETLEIPIAQIKSLRLSKSNQYIKDYLITQASFILSPFIVELVHGFDGIFTIVVSILSAPIVPVIALIINRVQHLKIDLNGNHDNYISSQKLINAYLLKKNKYLKE